jgi:plasmid replication initiation protein
MEKGQVYRVNTGTELADCNVSMSNKLIRASHALKLVEKRLIAAAIAKIDSRQGQAVHAHLSKFQSIRITALDFAESFDIDERNAYKELKAATDDLFNRYFTLADYSKDKKHERYTKYRWIDAAKYAEGEGFVELSFTAHVYPHLHMLEREYTTYRLKNAAALRSVYSWRMYELAKSWLEHCKKKQKPVQLTLEQLRDTLETPNSYRWDHVKRRALEPAIKEIAEKDNLIITYQPYKKGRSVAGIHMFVQEDDQGDLFKQP